MCKLFRSKPARSPGMYHYVLSKSKGKWIIVGPYNDYFITNERGNILFENGYIILSAPWRHVATVQAEFSRKYNDKALKKLERFLGKIQVHEIVLLKAGGRHGKSLED